MPESNPPEAPARPVGIQCRLKLHAMTAWRLIELIGLLATIPAFYMALQPSLHIASAVLYAAACATSIAVLWN